MRPPKSGLTFDTMYAKLKKACLAYKNDGSNKKVFLHFFRNKTRFKKNFKVFYYEQKIAVLSLGLRDIEDDTPGFDEEKVSPFFFHRVSAHTHIHPTPIPPLS